MNVTIKRGITGIFIIAFIVFPILASQWHFLWFTGLFGVLTFLSLYEFYGLVNKHGAASPQRIAPAVAGTFMFILTSIIVQGYAPAGVFAVIPFIFILIMLPELYLKKASPFTSLAYSFLGIVWIAVPFSLMNILFLGNFYPTAPYVPLLSVFIFSWVNDTAAYLTGITLGKRRLFERISPKKSWEGTIGGLLFTCVAAFVLSQFWTGFSFPVWLAFGLITAVAGIYGDLTESLFKRNINCKDSGKIMPGHGGFLDRFDCIFFAVPAVLFFLFMHYYLFK